MQATDKDINHEYALRNYNALYCNQTYRGAVQAYLEAVGAGQGLKDYEFGGYLTDAALECCGHEYYRCAVMVVLSLARSRGRDVVIAVLKHLENFATLDHIATLENMDGAK